MAEAYLRQLRNLVAAVRIPEEVRARLECRHFFGGAALYVDGRICGSFSAAGLALKLPVVVRQEMLEGGRGQPLRYFEGGRVKKEYVVLSEDLAADLVAVEGLLRASVAYVGGTIRR